MTYQAVAKALTAGADPRMLCQTCPWDRYCIRPPEMTRADIDRAMQDAEAADQREAEKFTAAGKPAPFMTGSLLTAMVLGGRDQQASVCPVLTLRMQSSQGRRIADTVKGLMQDWDDQA